MQVLFLDLETTGVDQDTDAVIQIGAMLWKDGEVLDKYTGNLNPFTREGDLKPQITLGALLVNKVSLKTLATYPVEGVTVREFVDWLLEIKKKYGDFYVCGWNVHFDMYHLEALLARYHIFEFRNLVGHTWIDLASFAVVLHGVGKIPVDRPKSDIVFKYYSIKNDHTAMGDVLANIELFKKMVLATLI